MYPDNYLRIPRYILFYFGRRGQAIFSSNKFQAQYKFGFYRLSKKSWPIVINIKNKFFGKISKKILIVLLHQSRNRIYIGIIAYTTWICTIVRTKRSNSNHIVTKLSCQGAIQNYMGPLFLILSLWFTNFFHIGCLSHS